MLMVCSAYSRKHHIRLGTLEGRGGSTGRLPWRAHTTSPLDGRGVWSDLASYRAEVRITTCKLLASTMHLATTTTNHLCPHQHLITHHHNRISQGGWTTDRHRAYATTDIQSCEVPRLDVWLRGALRARLLPQVCLPTLSILLTLPTLRQFAKLIVNRC
jgi:hypothetical protein